MDELTEPVHIQPLDELKSDNLRQVSNESMRQLYEVPEQVKQWHHKLQAARYAMHRVRLMHYQTMMKNGIMQPDIAKQFYLSAMQNYDDMMKGSANGCFSEAIEREMKEFDINEAFGD